jgi:hypothetical protein
MHHDKKTQLHHQDILIRRGFNIPAAEAIAPADETANDVNLSEAQNTDVGKQKVNNKKVSK